MALFKSGRQAEARDLLQAADSSVARLGNVSGQDDFGTFDLENRLIEEVLRREAHAHVDP